MFEVCFISQENKETGEDLFVIYGKDYSELRDGVTVAKQGFGTHRLTESMKVCVKYFVKGT